jgi:hypothetical protein
MTVKNHNWLIGVAAACVAIVSATDHASSWNDGSRLATVECLIDHGTWAIDESVFVKPQTTKSGNPHPYGSQAEEFPLGTLDKLNIDGHYYSDKSPVPAVLMAGMYSTWLFCGGPSAAERPDLFCRWMTFSTVGLAYVAAVLCINALASRVGLCLAHRLLVVAAFAFGSLALPYSRSVNNHELLLGVTAALLLALDRASYVWAGCLAGLAYSIDLGAGPAICVGATGFIIAQEVWSRRSRSVSDWRLPTQDSGSLPKLVVFFATMTPWLFLHHALNYHIGGTWRPANANPEYFNFPGCPFDATTLSGTWNHSSFIGFLGYTIDLLVGKKGFWGHNLQLLIALPSLLALLTRPHRRRSMVWLCAVWCIGVWLIYAAGSKNYSGACVSVRWFVPLIAPLMYIVMLTLRARPSLMPVFERLTVCGMVINALAWWSGPWREKMIVGYWPICVIGLVGSYRICRDTTHPSAKSSQLLKAA